MYTLPDYCLPAASKLLSFSLHQDFESVADAEALMETAARFNIRMGQSRLRFDYSHGPTSGGAAPNGEVAQPLDWVCAMCNTVNFAR
jgi:hypothetical protein